MALLIPFSGSSVAALGFSEPEKTSNEARIRQNIPFTGGGESEDTTETTCSDSEFSGDIGMEAIYKFLKEKGLSPVQAAGAYGNIYVESGGTGDPEIVEGGARASDPTNISGGWGIIQWTPGSKIIGLLEQAGITTPPNDLQTQLDLVWWHMNNTSPPGHLNMYAEYKTITDIETATKQYMDLMEAPNPKYAHLDKRIQYAKEAIRDYEGGDTDTASVDSEDTGGGCSTDEGGIASADGFTFPLITTKKAIINNSDGLWCYAKTSNCHHDYKAADIMITTGTTVIAAKSGVVQNVNSGNQHPNNVTIKTDDGIGINYYTHLGANTVKVRVGQHVKAEDILGEVGTREDAMNTGPHLHFDMLPPAYDYRPGCSGSGCSSLPFLEVQPALIKTFERLPEE